jgi:hypothetical protein
MCLADGKLTPATIADHVEPHRGDANLFWRGALQSLCDHCHESRKKIEETRGYRLDVGLDGWPLDPNHPANAGCACGAAKQKPPTPREAG